MVTVFPGPSAVPVLVTTTEQRGSRRMAEIRCRCAPDVSHIRPFFHMHDMITPIGHPSRVAQLNTHSIWLASSFSRTSGSTG